MVDATTTNYGLTKPSIGGSDDTWGDKLNANLDLIDAALKTIADAAGVVMTPAQILAALITADGASSGLDADLLDGREASYFQPVSTLLDAVKAIDGTGSGIDADLLDGRHASEFLLTFTGLIVMWSGTIASIPAGWALCNGANGTPDLRDRFVVGAGTTYAPGATGGAATHNHGVTVDGTALTTAQLPSHNHTMFANVASDTDLSGATSVAYRTTSSPGESEYVLSTGGATAATLGLTGSTGSGDTHAHTASSANASSLPPYYALAFIMKL